MPTLVERLRCPKRWCCIFEHEGHMRHGDSSAPFEAADALDAADHVLSGVKIRLTHELEFRRDESVRYLLRKVERALTLLRKGKEK